MTDNIKRVYGDLGSSRVARIPVWLRARLDSLVYQFDDLEKDLEVAKTAVPDPIVVDHTRPNLATPGRYKGDYFASLEYQPMREDKYRWLVTVLAWEEDRYNIKGHKEGYVDKDYWGSTHSVFDQFTTKRFKTSAKAIAYLLSVRSAADAEMIRQRLDRVQQGQSTRIA